MASLFRKIVCLFGTVRCFIIVSNERRGCDLKKFFFFFFFDRKIAVHSNDRSRDLIKRGYASLSGFIVEKSFPHYGYYFESWKIVGYYGLTFFFSRIFFWKGWIRCIRPIDSM